ncbi:hypothetical protein K1T71_006189 [Dendrolimus kikuchii]|uniref:Uncharacterized protein n=1 Tax=Dendrolimus kikuchii TaxID=765133 RepID=A0ACC1D329_9NEOP|nr:hypothetical protein K1T71_006189 [Dendrolimus kikuchii]
MTLLGRHAFRALRRTRASRPGCGWTIKGEANANLNKKWADSQWAQKLANKEKRAQMTDYDRFKLTSARVKRNRARTAVFKSLKMKAARAGTLGKRNIPKTPAKKPRVKKAVSSKPAKK